LELFYGWNGLLIEPIDSTFQKLKKNRNGRRNFLLKAACVSSSYSLPTVDIIYANLMSTAVGLDTDVEDPVAHAEYGTRFLAPDDSIRVEQVPAITMTRALEIAKAPGEIGLLSLDVEGAELEVLKGIDFQKYQFNWIVVESRKIGRISDFLDGHGYVLLSKLSKHDYLFQSRVSERV
jgi:FkbM family methyltransferase